MSSIQCLMWEWLPRSEANKIQTLNNEKEVRESPLMVTAPRVVFTTEEPHVTLYNTRAPSFESNKKLLRVELHDQQQKLIQLWIKKRHHSLIKWYLQTMIIEVNLRERKIHLKVIHFSKYVPQYSWTRKPFYRLLMCLRAYETFPVTSLRWKPSYKAYWN